MGSVQISPGREGYNNLSATILAQWHGKTLGQAPSIKGEVDTSDGNHYPVTVVSSRATLIADGFAVPATISGEFPLRAANPVLNVSPTDGAAFEPRHVQLGGASPAPETVLMPAAPEGAALEVSGVARFASSALTVWRRTQSNDGSGTLYAKHGQRELRYSAGIGDDYWVVTVGFTVTNLGGSDLRPESLLTTMVDQTWSYSNSAGVGGIDGQSAPVLSDPRGQGSLVPPGFTKSVAFVFWTKAQPKDLRMVIAWPGANGQPIAWSVSALDESAISDGETAFKDVMNGVDTFQGSCVYEYQDAGPHRVSITRSYVDAVGVLNGDVAVVWATDNFATITNKYALERSTGQWVVKSASGAGSGKPGSC